ncbi:hypothetical protein [Secundilactobacillus yichangensis]|uniref:hypothetical protein n=1 Tax=Secundilactobacillus yichangensis TaxID=2799580 RepID=UPI001940AB6B|nr:hypothetical protein [Secundilactobacillus yichangensis]
MDKETFISLYNDEINKIVNQDAVRSETIKREREDGTLDNMIEGSTYIARTAYLKALNQGFNDDQAFVIGLRQAGYISDN